MCYLLSYNNSFVILLSCLLKYLHQYDVAYLWGNCIRFTFTSFLCKLHRFILWKITLFHDCFIIDITPGLLSSEDDAGTINEREMITNKEFPSERNYKKSNVMAEKKPLPSDIPSSLVLQIKSVFKCRICPRVICLTEDTLRNHLQSKVLHFFLWFLNAYASILTIRATIV